MGLSYKLESYFRVITTFSDNKIHFITKCNQHIIQPSHYTSVAYSIFVRFLSFIRKPKTDVFTLIRARDFDRAQKCLRTRSGDAANDSNYYRCLAKIAELQSDYTSAIDLYKKSVDSVDSGTRRFLVYGDLVGLLYLTGQTSTAQLFLDRAIGELEQQLQRSIISAHSLVHLSKFALRLGLAECYMTVLNTKCCWNPWHRKLKVARKNLAKSLPTLVKLSAFQANYGHSLDSFKSPNVELSDQVDVVVFLPKNYLVLLLRNSVGLAEYYETIIEYLEENKIRFNFKNQFVLNYCPQLVGVKVLSWHTCGIASGLRHLKESPFSGFFYFDRAGYSGWAELATQTDEQIKQAVDAVPIEQAEIYFQSLVERFITARKSKYDQTITSQSLPDRYVFIPMQLLDDHVTKLTDWDIFDLIRLVMRLLEGTNVSLVLKRHPKCTHWLVDTFLTEVESHPLVLIVDAQIHDLIESSIAVCTVNSGVGAEALLSSKQVFTVSPTDYDFLAHDLRNISSNSEFMAMAEAEVDRVKYAKFMTFYCRD